MTEKLVTPEFRLSFPQLFEPKGFENGKPKFGLTQLYPKGTDLSKLKKMAFDAIVEKWSPDKKKWPGNLRSIDFKTYLSPTGKDRWPFRDGDAQNYDGYEGQISLSARNETRPAVVGPDKQPIIDTSTIYPGCYGHAVLTAYAYDKSGNRGVAFSLLAFMKTRDGESFTTRFDPSDFDGVDYGAMADAEDAANYAAIDDFT